MASLPSPRRVTIVGVGLMGGSLGLAIKRFCPEVDVIGVDQNTAILLRAQERGAIHWGTPDLVEGVTDADLIFLATPIGAILALLPALAPCIPPGAIVSDLGSTKREICRAAQKYLPQNFVGGHPMTGSERKGLEAADPFLFENAIYVLTPLRPDDEKAQRLADFLRQLGASPLLLSPEHHDRLAAYVSHLPQLLAVALTHLIGEKSARDGFYRELAAGGLRDMTRIASSPYELWHDILFTNQPEIEQALEAMISQLRAMHSALRRGTLRESFQKAADFRNALPPRSKGFLQALYRLAVVVPDRPGELAAITTAIARAGINISDIELLRVREGAGGTFHLYFARPEEAIRVQQLLRAIGYESLMID